MDLAGLSGRGDLLARRPRVLRSFLLKIPVDSTKPNTTHDRRPLPVVGGQGQSALSGATRLSPRPMGTRRPCNTLEIGPEISLWYTEKGLPPKPSAVARGPVAKRWTRPSRPVMEQRAVVEAGAGGCTYVGCRCATQDPRACMPPLCGTLPINEEVSMPSVSPRPQKAALTERGAMLGAYDARIANAFGLSCRRGFPRTPPKNPPPRVLPQPTLLVPKSGSPWLRICGLPVTSNTTTCSTTLASYAATGNFTAALLLIGAMVVLAVAYRY